MISEGVLLKSVLLLIETNIDKNFAQVMHIFDRSFQVIDSATFA